MPASSKNRILIVEARFYQDISDELARGAIAALDEAGYGYDRLAVPGALEIPPAIAMAVDAGLLPFGAARYRYDGAVALGCVIRGETTHYETVANESARWLMQIATTSLVPIGNGILTVENSKQAWARAEGGTASKGADAARACIRLAELMRQFHKQA
ncbi:MAG: 6,7-dimethyl-8-ribityllumazine synthase [Rhizobiales bacterium]|nr:6,7-dimethyl-8-ribityllumazine synthase [Hyphomicrobiales bacterium]